MERSTLQLQLSPKIARYVALSYSTPVLDKVVSYARWLNLNHIIIVMYLQLQNNVIISLLLNRRTHKKLYHCYFILKDVITSTI